MLTRTCNQARVATIAMMALAAIVAQSGAGLAAAGRPGAKPNPARFTSAAAADVGGTFPGGTAVADFTGDHRPDVAVSVSSVQATPGVVVVVGNGRGGFAGRIDTALPGNARACDLATGDLNGDGNADLVVSTCSSGESPVLVMTGNGDGTSTSYSNWRWGPRSPTRRSASSTEMAWRTSRWSGAGRSVGVLRQG